MRFPATRLVRSLLAGLALGLCLLAAPASASAATAAWEVSSLSLPTNFAPGDSTGNDTYILTATNVGDAATDASDVTITDRLPAGLTVSSVQFFVPSLPGSDVGGFLCTSAGTNPAVCTYPGFLAGVAPGEQLQMIVHVTVGSGLSEGSSVTNAVTISGGGAPEASGTSTNLISASTPAFGAQSFDMSIRNSDGTPATQAGSHPYALTTAFMFPTDQNGKVAENVKDIKVDLPPGLVGDPQATPKCTFAELPTGCPADAQVGTLTLYIPSSGTLPVPGTFPVYNMVPRGGQPAQFGASIFNGTVVATDAVIDTSVRTGGDYGLTTTVTGIPANGEPIYGSSVTFWGVPADPSHDSQRCVDASGNIDPTRNCSSGAPLKALLTLPSACLGPQTATLSVDSWQHQNEFARATATLPATDGCNRLDFRPSITVRPDTSVANSPTGLNVDLKVPQPDAPNGLAEATLKDASVTLPAGVSVNPSSANGLAACTPAQIGIDNANEPACPDASKIGSVEVDTPLLPDPLDGAIYVAQQNNNPFGSLLAIYVTAQADGVIVKLAGHVVPDPVTGQLVTTFSNNPQLPFTDFKLDFFGGPHAALATPQSCGTFSTTSSLVPWSGTGTVASSDSFTITNGCVSGFAPSFTAGTENAQAGSYSPFVLSFSRSDTDQDLSGLTVKLPPGMLAKLAGVQECTDAQIAAAAGKSGATEQANPSCPAGSQVGTVTTGSGAGPDPFFLGGKAYLTGPYKGGPYGLAVVVPAVAGPYDLGTVVVRQALYIDPTTAQVTAVSDSFPTILQGIPLRIRRIDVSLNRSGFTVNPTSCNPMAVSSTLTSTGGLTYAANSRFQVGGCQDLAFSPKLKLALSGKGKTRSGNHPTLTATLTDPSGQANIRSAKVALPLSLALDPNNSQHVCNYTTAQAVHGGSVGCPASTIVGTATAQTPLLSEPLSGPVYLVQGIRFGKNGQQIHRLPTLLVPLRGQIALDLRAQSAVSRGKLVTTFSTIPDAPVSKFTLKINGGRKGILVITGRGKTICGKKQVSNATLGAQSGKAMRSQVKLSTPCKAVKKARHHGAKRQKNGHERTNSPRGSLVSLVGARLRGW